MSVLEAHCGNPSMALLRRMSYRDGEQLHQGLLLIVNWERWRKINAQMKMAAIGNLYSVLTYLWEIRQLKWNNTLLIDSRNSLVIPSGTATRHFPQLNCCQEMKSWEVTSSCATTRLCKRTSGASSSVISHNLSVQVQNSSFDLYFIVSNYCKHVFEAMASRIDGLKKWI